MRAARRLGAAVAALTLAGLPGALRLVPGSHGVERAALAPPVDAVTPDPAPVASVALQPPPPKVAAPAVTAPSLPAPPTTLAPPPSAATAPVPAVATGSPPAAAPPPAPTAAAAFEHAGASTSGAVYALIVGINDYPGSDHDLRSAVGDADTVEQAMAHFGVPAGNRVVLRDGQAHRAQLVAAVEALVRRAGPGSTIVFSYAGHVRKVDSDTEEIIAADGAALTDQDLARLLAPARSQHLWLLLATCYGGGFTELLGPGRVLTAAADAGSLAYESPHLGASYLVHHMVREGWLQGKAGPTVQEAFAYADARIAQRYPGGRRPVQIDRAGSLRLGRPPAR